jgi:GT2 family glycosyltransferase/glycosyltransferase involved in cell wall biosynthesis
MTPTPQPFISVIIPTFNRADLLSRSLESLAVQTLPKDRFEVVVIDDGSPDNTKEVCEGFAERLSLRYQRQVNSGISAAKNMGVFMSRGPLLMFFDDDDVADADLLTEHVKTHTEHPQENVAVLGYTTWHPSLTVSRVMHFVTDIGGFLFSYGTLEHGQALDFTYFWGGRSSCKKSLLVRHGVFNQLFRFGSEDIELGYRLSRQGLIVIYNRNAKSYMIRPLTYDQFCQRCIKQGRSQYHFSRMHPDPVIQKYCMVDDVERKWAFVRQRLDEKMQRARDLERTLEGELPPAREKSLLNDLGKLYWWTFTALKIKGVMEEKEADPDTTPAQPAGPAAAGVSDRDLERLGAQWKDRLPSTYRRGNVLVVDPLLPMYDRASGSLRLFEIVKALIRMGFHVTYIARNGEHAAAYVPTLQAMGVEVYAGDPTALQDMGLDIIAPHLDVEGILKAKRFDYAILSFWHIAEHYLPLVRRHSPHTHVIIDTVDIHFLREFREAEMKKDPLLLETARSNKERELAVYRKGDRLWVVTEDDRKTIEGIVKAPIDVVPNIHKKVSWTKEYDQTRDLLFVGNFNHKPNIDAVLFLHKKIFPLVSRKLPDTRVYIVGNNPPDQIRRLHSDRFVVTGYVEDLEPYLRDARISINPLTYGAGMKGKVGEALSWGLPVVTTSIGAEGMDLQDGETAMVADDPKVFARKVIDLYHDRTAWERLSRNGRRHVEQRWSPAAIQKRIDASFLQARPVSQGHVSLILQASHPGRNVEDAVTSLHACIDAPGETVVIAEGFDDTASRALLELEHAPHGGRTVRSLAAKTGSKPVPLWNRALSLCGCEILVLCRNSATRATEALRSLVSYARQHPETAVLTPRTPLLQDSPAFPGITERTAAPLPFMVVRSAVVTAIGGLDAGIQDDHLAWCDFIMRASDQGFQAACPREEPRVDEPACTQQPPAKTPTMDWLYFTDKWGLPLDACPDTVLTRRAEPTAASPFEHFSSLGEQNPEGSTASRPAAAPGAAGERTDKAPAALTSIVILCFNGLAYTRQCLDSVDLFTPEPHEIIIVDNGSTDGTPGFLKQYAAEHDGVTLIMNDRNMGYAAGNNQAIRAARGEYVVLLNNDVVVTDGWLGRMIGHMEGHADTGMVGPITNSVSGAQLLTGVPYGTDMDRMHAFAREVQGRNAGRTEHCMRLVGFCLLIRRQVLDIIGGLDEGYLTGNYEDDDLCLRSCIAGFRNIIARDVFVHHFGSMTFKVNSMDHSRTMDANREHFLRKWKGIVRHIKADNYWVRIEKHEQTERLVAWGEEAFACGDVLRALRIFERALIIEPRSTQALNNLGVIQWELGHPDAALETFQTALTIRPDDPDTLSNLSDALASGGNRDLLRPEIRGLMDRHMQRARSADVPSGAGEDA